MKKICVALLCMAAFVAANLAAQQLPQFTSDRLKTVILGKEVAMPYTFTVSYFGYVKPGSPAEEEVGGKKMYYVYVWVPAVADEMGVRMISPVTTIKPKAADFVSPLWAEGSKNTADFFDTWVTFQRADGLADPMAIDDAKIKGAKWISYGSNDDSGELPANPAGNKYNSVLRIVSEPSNPGKALVRGLYRIGFTTYKVGEVKGTFLAQVAATVKLPGLIVEKETAELIKKLKEAK